MGRMSLVSPDIDLDVVRAAMSADVVLVMVPGIAPETLLVLDRAGTTDHVPPDVIAPAGSLLARVLAGIHPGRVERLGLVGAGSECTLGPTLLLPVKHPLLGDAVLLVSRSAPAPSFDESDFARVRELTEPPSGVLDVASIGGNATFRYAFEAAAAGMSLVDSALRYRWVNAPLCEMLGRSQRELLSMLVTDTVHPEHVDRAVTFYDRLRTGQVGAVRDRLRLLRPDERTLWAEVGGSVVWGSTPEALVLVQQFDVTDEQVLADDFAYRAMHDELTGLANRALLRERLQAVIAHAQRDGTRGVVFYLDVDRFKQINDHHGHAAGDKVLVETASRLAGVVRAGDTVARIGGDEFVVAGHAADADEASRMAERIGVALAPRIDVGERTLSVSVSIGVALNGVLDSPDDLVDRADRALLKAKRMSRLHVVSTETT